MNGATESLSMTEHPPTTECASLRVHRVIPSRADPRWIFGGLLLLYAIAGFTLLGFNRDPLQVLTTLLACVLLEIGFARLLVGRWIFPLSAFITGLGLSLLVNYPHDYFLMLMPAFFAIASGYVESWQRWCWAEGNLRPRRRISGAINRWWRAYFSWRRLVRGLWGKFDAHP
jgi:hypothetical protein